MPTSVSEARSTGYCEDAYKLLRIKVVCGKDCPILGTCPRIIGEDAADELVTKMIDALLATQRRKRGGK